ncbi:hypothetical protein [Spiroplasma mirum]|nr:hypothetical protein [Spiroplasma atrichopogonis]AKM53138.1 hypothetical protein SATRI_v1c06750 [Spiroplasma atrichopogonis]
MVKFLGESKKNKIIIYKVRNNIFKEVNKIKTLLAILGVISFVATNSISVVSCPPLPNDGKSYLLKVTMDANNTEHYKWQAKITLLVVAATLDLIYFSGDFSQDGSYSINYTSQAELINAINSDAKMNPVIKSAVASRGIIVTTTTKILPNN